MNLALNIAGAFILTSSLLAGCAVAKRDERQQARNRTERRAMRRHPGEWFARLTRDMPRG